MPRARALALAVTTALAVAAVSGCSGSSEAPAPKPSRTSSSPSPTADPGLIGPAFFGVHDSEPSTWPDAPVGALRVWDSGVAWNQVEKSAGQFDFSRMDAIVQTARRHDADVLLVLGQTPAFHATGEQRSDAAYGAGASSMPDLDAWRTYVTKVVERYKDDRDVAFQVWNESNVINYWSGTPEQMAQLTGIAREVVDKVAPDRTLVAPAFVTRLAAQQRWMDEFYGQQVDGKPVADLVDVVSLQLYPAAGQALPESALAVLATDQAILAKHDVDKPIWNTEINYGAKGGKNVEPAADDVQADNVARTYILNAGYGVRRVYWYSWDVTLPIVNTYMVGPDGQSPAAGGRAFKTVHRWLVGTTAQGCEVGTDQTYTCTFVGDGETRTIMWNPASSVQVDVPKGATTAEKLIGKKQPVPAGSTLTLDAMPVLVISKG